MVKLRTLGRVYDITEYVDRPREFNDNVIGNYDMGVITIESIKSNALNGLDLSRRIPPDSIVEIETIVGTKTMLVETPEIEKINENEYRHVLKLVEPKKLLEDRPIPDTSTTQPIRDVVNYITESSKILNETFIGLNTGYTNNVDLQIVQVSNDPNILENRVIKESGTYNIDFNIVFGRLGGGLLPQINALVFELYTDDRVIYSKDFGRFGNLGWPTVGTLAFNENVELFSGEEIKLRAMIRGFAFLVDTEPVAVSISNKSGYLTIEKVDEQTSELIRVDEVVEKLLALVNVSDIPEFILDGSSKARLSNILMFDDMHTEATLKTALERIASYVGARLYVDIKNGAKIIRFEFYSEMSKQDYVEPNDEKYLAVKPSNDAISGVALQNNNVIRENQLTELSSIRSVDAGVNQITTNNIGVYTKYTIDKISKIEVKGKEFKDSRGVILLSKNAYLDITNNVIEKEHYDTLDNMAMYDNRLVNNKNNHLYYVRGDNRIYGMGYIGNENETWVQNRVNRAIYETMASVLVRQGLNVPKWVDNGLDDDIDLEFRITYYANSSSNAYVYKDDQSGFQEKRIQRLNANDRVNNADYLGAYARTTVNALGGTQISKSGITNDPSMIPQLGTVNDNNERVVSITYFEYENDIEYYITLVKDYIFQSMYVGTNSERRLMHIPKDEYVKRIDKSLNVIYLTQQPITYNLSVISPNMFLKSLNSDLNDKTAPKAAWLRFDNVNITSLLDVGATANTIEWNLEMEDNYSAGDRIKHNDELDIYYQYGVPYSDLFGRVNEVDVRYRENQSDSLGAKQEMPDGDWTNGTQYARLRYNVNKDAREQYALSLQTAILSDDDEIIVYNGLGKYNLMANNEKYNIELAVLNYKPNKDDKYIDYGRITTQSNNAFISDYYIETYLHNAGKGYAFYEKNSGEMLLAVSKDLNVGEHIIYMYADNYDFGGKEQYDYVIDINGELGYQIDVDGIKQETYIIDIESELGYSINVDGIIQETYLIDIDSSLGYQIESTGVEQERYEININSVLGYQINTQGMEQERYSIDVNSVLGYNINVDGQEQERYYIDVASDLGYSIEVDGRVQEKYNINVDSGLGYEVNVLGQVQEKYEIDIVSNLGFGISQTGSGEGITPEQPSTTASASTLNQVYNGADGYSKWIGRSRVESEYIWFRDGGITYDTSRRTVIQGGTCYYEGEKARGFLPGANNEYESFTCTFARNRTVYYWELID